MCSSTSVSVLQQPKKVDFQLLNSITPEMNETTLFEIKLFNNFTTWMASVNGFYKFCGIKRGRRACHYDAISIRLHLV